MGGTYYDMLGTNAFNNYRSLINDVTLSPAMGLFLSHFNNPKADPTNNIHPDENYAREIMQLFSIPTYTNEDIKEFAQVFTGLGDGRANGTFGLLNDEDDGILQTVVIPMKMYDDYHDTSEKNLLKSSEYRSIYCKIPY